MTTQGNIEHLQLLKQGRESWNAWKNNNPIRSDFRGFDLSGMDLSGYHLDHSDFTECNMSNCNLDDAWLCWCIFIRTNLSNSTLLSSALENFDGDKRLLGVNLRWSSFAATNLQNVRMNNATLEASSFYDCNFKGADISNSDVYGVSAWGNEFDENTKQDDLVITKWGEPIITISNLEVAQFIYLATNSKGVRSAINTLSTKVVLILGSFQDDDKKYLDDIKFALKHSNYVPMMYDFEKPDLRNHTDTVSTLAHLSSFIVADLTNQRSIPHELASIVTQLRSVPVIPIIRDGQKPYGMFEDFRDLNHIGDIVNYSSDGSLLDLAKTITTSASSIIANIHGV